jgi:hypothetical protein
MPADTSIESLEPIQPSVEKDVGTSSAVLSPQPEPYSEKVLCFYYSSDHSSKLFASSKKIPLLYIYIQALNSLALSYSFNFEEFIDESEISSSVVSSQQVLLDMTKNQLRDMLPML